MRRPTGISLKEARAEAKVLLGCLPTSTTRSASCSSSVSTCEPQVSQIRADAKALLNDPEDDSVNHAAELRNMLVNLFLDGALTSSMLVELSLKITRTGGVGVEDFARDLQHKKNSYKVVDNVIGRHIIKQECLIYPVIPQNVRRGKKAKRVRLAMLPFYEVMSREFKKHTAEYMVHASDPTLLCDNFHRHLVVQEHGSARCLPIRLFVDYAKLDNQVSTLNIAKLC